jgi:hypothetical protein
MKNLSLGIELSCLISETPSTSAGARSFAFDSWSGEGLLATGGFEGGVKAAGPVGMAAPGVAGTDPLRSRLTSLTVWNFESCIFTWASVQLASSL